MSQPNAYENATDLANCAVNAADFDGATTAQDVHGRTVEYFQNVDEQDWKVERVINNVTPQMANEAQEIAEKIIEDKYQTN